MCGRWVHEDCITYNIIKNVSGRELCALFAVCSLYFQCPILIIVDFKN